ncbi:hypothetical protein F5Y08DRAFT_309165 [Xylaria arbuscula]|nr:hypothetical protein F5Y08DRAFT_309165 [Xylaria arbuscula]
MPGTRRRTVVCDAVDASVLICTLLCIVIGRGQSSGLTDQYHHTSRRLLNCRLMFPWGRFSDDTTTVGSACRHAQQEAPGL